MVYFVRPSLCSPHPLPASSSPSLSSWRSVKNLYTLIQELIYNIWALKVGTYLWYLSSICIAKQWCRSSASRLGEFRQTEWNHDRDSKSEVYFIQINTFVCMLRKKQCVSGQDAPMLPLLLLPCSTLPLLLGHIDHGRLPLGSWQDPKAQDLASHSKYSPKCCSLVQTCKALIFLLKTLWLAALDFSSPSIWIPALWKFASIVQASQGCYWIAGCSRAIKVTLGKSAASWFSFQSRWGPSKGTSNLQQRGRKSKEKTGPSPALSQEGLLPAWVGGRGN